MAEIRYYLCDWCQKKVDNEALPEGWKSQDIHDPFTMVDKIGHFCMIECADAYIEIQPSAIVSAKDHYQKEYFNILRKVRGDLHRKV